MQRRLGNLPDSADGLPVRLSDGLVPWRAGRLHREHYGRQDARLPSQAGSLTSGLAIQASVSGMTLSSKIRQTVA